jgi:hypothetical protein
MALRVKRRGRISWPYGRFAVFLSGKAFRISVSRLRAWLAIWASIAGVTVPAALLPAWARAIRRATGGPARPWP